MAIPRGDHPGRLQTGPSITDRRRRPKRFRLLSAAFPILLCNPGWAAKWEVAPTLLVGEIYTDNVSLTPDASKQSDWITQVIPGISINATGTGLKFHASYNPEVLYFAQGDKGSEIFQRGSASGTAELAERLLFIDVGANVDQYDASLQGPLTTSNFNTTGNRTTVRNYFASPYLRRDFGSDLQAEARFTESIVDSDDPSSVSNSSSSSLSDSTAERIELHLKSGPAYTLQKWGFDYYREAIDYKNSEDDTVTELVSATGRRLITATVGLLAQAGYDHYDSGDLVSESEGPSWGLGLDWTPSRNTRLTVIAGHRFFGNAYSMDFSHLTRLTAWSVKYSENVTTARTELSVASTSSTAGYLDQLFTSQYADPAAREKAVGDFIARTGLPPSLNAPVTFFSNELFLVKKWQASAGILGVRNVVIANVFREDSESLNSGPATAGAGDFATSGTVIQTGTSVLWNWRITAKDAWNLGGAYSRNEFPDTGRIDKLAYVGMGVTRQLQPRLFAALNYRRQQSNSSEGGASYTENAVFATIQQRF